MVQKRGLRFVAACNGPQWNLPSTCMWSSDPNQGVIYTVDHEVVTKPYKFCDFDVELVVGHEFCGERGNRGALVEEGKGPWKKNVVIINSWWFFVGGREDEHNRRQANDQTFPPPFFKTTCFGFFLNKNKNQHNYFLVHGHSSWSMLGLRLVKDPKTL